MSSMAAVLACTLLLLTGSEAEEKGSGGEKRSGDSVGICTELVRRFEGHDDIELAAVCRARANPAECHDARRALGPRPWSEESILAACTPWPDGRLLQVIDVPATSPPEVPPVVCKNATGKAPCPAAVAIPKTGGLGLSDCENMCAQTFLCFGISFVDVGSETCQLWTAMCDIDSQPDGSYFLENGACLLSQKLEHALQFKGYNDTLLDTSVASKSSTTLPANPEELWSAAPGGSVATALLSTGGVVATAAGLGFMALAFLAGRSRWGCREMDLGVHTTVPTDEDDGDFSLRQEEATRSDDDEDREVSRPLMG